MGCNYFFQVSETPPPCPTCAHVAEPQRVHIGKSSVGWTFSLRSWPLGLGRSYPDEQGVAGGDPVTTWQQWRKLLLMPGVVVVDEYERRMPVADFIDRVESKQRDPENMNHSKEAIRGAFGLYEHACELDPEGYSMCARAFS